MRNGGPPDINNFQFRILLNHSHEVRIPHPVVLITYGAYFFVVPQRDQVGSMPCHEVETFSPMCCEMPSRELIRGRHLDSLDVGEKLAHGVVELDIHLEEPGQVEGAELREHKRCEQLDGKVTQRYAHFVYRFSGTRNVLSNIT